MRVLAVLALLCSLFATLALADPLLQRDSKDASNRVGIAFGKPGLPLVRGDADSRQAAKADLEGDTANYLITLDRSISNVTKDKILDVLLRLNAVVKQEYNYRVYKGILFTIPAAKDKGLSSWQSSLSKLAGVKYVEKDDVVTTQAKGDKD
ncbi:hypothetical protein Rhopal_000613-T1 [Rhodotorula paludigena]|uniref:Uncharacterized protein n=1 Tax=Rhodotorula paludigena TaxID=86838 RepID=A0AAV5GC58_9BASI|nr:hypothetical protein Rhopal_000613-T1 [Rhodotorula paludigena]